MDDITELEIKITEANMPEHAHKAAVKELGQLKQMAHHMPEYTMTWNHLDLVVDLPWSVSVQETCNISKARADLDADLYGLEEVKCEVLKYLSFRQLHGSLKTRILCFVGPPGVCKTSIVKSIASTLGRPYLRISLDGVSDQRYICGHQGTYIGAMPGRVIQGLRTVKVNNPVMLLDDIDKLGTSIHGEPGAALLKVIDPEQNSSFTDTYLNLPFDLSQVLFVATANTLAQIPPALLVRMVVINIPGYTRVEKVMIGSLHLLPKQLEGCGLSADILKMPKHIIDTIITGYTNETGVRTLEHKIQTVCMDIALQVAETISDYSDDDEEHSQHLESVLSRPLLNLTQLRKHMELPITVDSKMIQDILGPPIFQSGVAGHLIFPGIAVGLAAREGSNAGRLFMMEASCLTGDSHLTLTGQIGPAFQEAVKVALSWIHQNSTWLGIDKDCIKDDIHMHFPDGKTPKDGPSGGITVLTALVSLFSNRCVRSDVAMTGKITIRGDVLPVGGIKAKLLGAYEAGMTTVILPADNVGDLDSIPFSVLNKVEVVFVSTVEQVLEAAF